MLRPESPQQLVEALQAAGSAKSTIRLGGNFSKNRLGGAPLDADVTISTARMTRLLQYEPRDLTISVEAGMRFTDLEAILEENHQMLPLDPPFAESTVGGVIASNLSGPRRRVFGTARDMVIGMTFASLEGKLIDSGGMVVKNVAGLDMAKLMIGSFGTLAAIATVNFKLVPIPAVSRSYVMEFATAAEVFAARDRILKSPLLPAAIDIVNWPSGFRLLIRAGGNAAMIERFSRELSGARQSDDGIWDEVRGFTPDFLDKNPEGGVVTVHVPLASMTEAAAMIREPFIARAASGVFYVHHARNTPTPAFGSDFAMMEKVKDMFDPGRLLNPGRLYGRI